MKDRQSQFPGRRYVIPEDGTPPFYATVVRADEPTVAGTPLEKNTLLRDATQQLFGFTADTTAQTTTVDQVLAAIGAGHTIATQAEAAAGSSTTVRRWTPQRVAQAAISAARAKRLVATITSSQTINLANYTTFKGAPIAVGDKIDIYMVGAGGGGGAGGNAYSPNSRGGGGGGGGGRAVFVEDFVLSASSYPMVIGAPGAGGTASAGNVDGQSGSAGGATTAFGYTAPGGQPGGGGLISTSAASNGPGGNGGSGGGRGGGGASTAPSGYGGEGGLMGSDGGAMASHPGGVGEGTPFSASFTGSLTLQDIHTPINPYDGKSYGNGGGGGANYRATGMRAPGGKLNGFGGGDGGASATDSSGEAGLAASPNSGSGGGGGAAGNSSTTTTKFGGRGGDGGTGVIFIYA